jgi:hypothetical protein
MNEALLVRRAEPHALIRIQFLYRHSGVSLERRQVFEFFLMNTVFFSEKSREPFILHPFAFILQLSGETARLLRARFD